MNSNPKATNNSREWRRTLTVSKTTDRIPRSSSVAAHTRPETPPPMTATTGSVAGGVANTTCSWEKLFLITDLREVPYDPALRLGFRPRVPPSMALRRGGGGLGSAAEERSGEENGVSNLGFRWGRRGFEGGGLRGCSIREEGKGRAATIESESAKEEERDCFGEEPTVSPLS